ncbi:hypothetical protein F4780DRAFT_749577 [Xylariomycetidae sp. FL0641]|nr:hypothetical protein F4780DRAFT_749577 [Xylariomycetidae sp. FL0641]
MANIEVDADGVFTRRLMGRTVASITFLRGAGILEADVYAKILALLGIDEDFMPLDPSSHQQGLVGATVIGTAHWKFKDLIKVAILAERQKNGIDPNFGSHARPRIANGIQTATPPKFTPEAATPTPAGWLAKLSNMKLDWSFLDEDEASQAGRVKTLPSTTGEKSSDKKTKDAVGDTDSPIVSSQSSVQRQAVPETPQAVTKAVTPAKSTHQTDSSVVKPIEHATGMTNGHDSAPLVPRSAADPIFGLFIKNVQVEQGTRGLFSEEHKAKITKVEKCGGNYSINEVAHFHSPEDRDAAYDSLPQILKRKQKDRSRPFVQVFQPRLPSDASFAKGDSSQAKTTLRPLSPSWEDSEVDHRVVKKPMRLQEAKAVYGEVSPLTKTNSPEKHGNDSVRVVTNSQVSLAENDGSQSPVTVPSASGAAPVKPLPPHLRHLQKPLATKTMSSPAPTEKNEAVTEEPVKHSPPVRTPVTNVAWPSTLPHQQSDVSPAGIQKDVLHIGGGSAKSPAAKALPPHLRYLRKSVTSSPESGQDENGIFNSPTPKPSANASSSGGISEKPETPRVYDNNAFGTAGYRCRHKQHM